MSDERFDFDYWKDLFNKSEKEFNAARLDLLEKQIRQLYPNDPDQQQRMRGSLHRMDTALNKVKNPIARLAFLKSGFWKQFDIFKESLQTTKNLGQDTTSESTVIQFPRKK